MTVYIKYGLIFLQHVYLYKIRLYKINSSIKDLAKVFDVSESAMTVRLSILDLL